MYLIPLKYCSMTVGTLKALMGLNSTAQPPLGLPPTHGHGFRNPSPKPADPAPVMLQQCWFPAPHSPALPSHGAKMSLPGLGLSAFPWRCPIPRPGSASLACPAPRVRAVGSALTAMPCTAGPLTDPLGFPARQPSRSHQVLLHPDNHSEKYNTDEQSKALHLTRSILLLLLTQNK